METPNISPLNVPRLPFEGDIGCSRRPTDDAERQHPSSTAVRQALAASSAASTLGPDLTERTELNHRYAQGGNTRLPSRSVSPPASSRASTPTGSVKVDATCAGKAGDDCDNSNERLVPNTPETFSRYSHVNHDASTLNLLDDPELLETAV